LAYLRCSGSSSGLVGPLGQYGDVRPLMTGTSMRLRQLVRRFQLVALATLLCLGARPAEAGEAITLRVAYANPHAYTEMMREIAARFEETHPSIKVALMPASRDYEELLQQLLRSAAVGQDLPDVAFHGLHRVRLLVDRGLVVPIKPFIAAEPNWAGLGYIPAMQTLGDQSGQSYALAFAVSTMIAHYNADLVPRAGGNPDKLPTTWPDIIDLAGRIRKLGDDVQGLYWFYFESNNNYTFHTLVQSFGGEMMMPDDRTIAFNSPAGQQALALVRRFGEAGMLDMTDSQAVQSFIAGKLGIYLASTARVDQLAVGARGHFRYVTGPLPVPAETATFPAGGAGVMMHTRDLARQRAAWEFMKFAAGPMGQTIVVRHSGYMPGNELALNDPKLLGGWYDDHPNHRTSLGQLPRMSRFYSFPGANSMKIPTVIRDHLQSVVTLKRRPDEVMPDMVRDVQALLPR